MKKKYAEKLEVTFHEESVRVDSRPQRRKENERKVIEGFFRQGNTFAQSFTSVMLTSQGAYDLSRLIGEEGISDLMDMSLGEVTFQDVLDKAPLYSSVKIKITIRHMETGLFRILYPVIFIKEGEESKTSLSEYRIIAMDMPRNRYSC